MSDANDAVAKAVALNKKLAATKLVRKEELEAELAKLRRERALIEGDAPDLDAQIDALATDVAVADGELKSALAEIDQLRKLGRGAQAGVARAMVGAALAEKDPLIQSYEEAALEGARSHIRDLDAQVRLGDELAGDRAAAEGIAPPARAKPLSKDEANAKARAEFEAMRARRGDPAKPAVPSDGAVSGGATMSRTATAGRSRAIRPRRPCSQQGKVGASSQAGEGARLAWRSCGATERVVRKTV